MNDDGDISGTLSIPEPIADLSKLKLIPSGPRHKLYRASASAVGIVVKITAETLPSATTVASMRHEYELPANSRYQGSSGCSP